MPKRKNLHKNAGRKATYGVRMVPIFAKVPPAWKAYIQQKYGNISKAIQNLIERDMNNGGKSDNPE